MSAVTLIIWVSLAVKLSQRSSLKSPLGGEPGILVKNL